MPRRSLFVIRLAEQERDELEARCEEYVSPYRDVMRAKVVLLASQALGSDRISAQFAAPRQTASKWRQRLLTVKPRHDRGPGPRPVGNRRRRAAWLQ